MTESGQRVRAVAPGRVNLIGEYTDLVDGLVLPMAIDRVTTVDGVRGGGVIELRSSADPDPVMVPIDADDPIGQASGWGRLVAAVVAELQPSIGFRGTVSSTVPIGMGLSSSAALTVAVALAFGFEGTPPELAALARRAEQRGTGVPCGIMDQLASAAGVAGHALLIDCAGPSVEPVPMPGEVEIRVIPTGVVRQVAQSAYGERKAALDRAAEVLGPLRFVEDPDRLEVLDDPVVRRRVRHVVTENLRVVEATDALRAGDIARFGAVLDDGHRSLRDDLEVSLPVIDALVERLESVPGVHGVRLTGAGFGGCVVAVADPGVLDEGWRVEPSAGAHLVG